MWEIIYDACLYNFWSAAESFLNYSLPLQPTISQQTHYDLYVQAMNELHECGNNECGILRLSRYYI